MKHIKELIKLSEYIEENISNLSIPDLTDLLLLSRNLETKDKIIEEMTDTLKKLDLKGISIATSCLKRCDQIAKEELE